MAKKVDTKGVDTKLFWRLLCPPFWGGQQNGTWTQNARKNFVSTFVSAFVSTYFYTKSLIINVLFFGGHVDTKKSLVLFQCSIFPYK